MVQLEFAGLRVTPDGRILMLDLLSECLPPGLASKDEVHITIAKHSERIELWILKAVDAWMRDLAVESEPPGLSHGEEAGIRCS